MRRFYTIDHGVDDLPDIELCTAADAMADRRHYYYYSLTVRFSSSFFALVFRGLTVFVVDAFSCATVGWLFSYCCFCEVRKTEQFIVVDDDAHVLIVVSKLTQ